MLATPRALTSHEGGCDDAPIAVMSVSWLDGVGGCAGPGTRGFAIQEENYVFLRAGLPNEPESREDIGVIVGGRQLRYTMCLFRLR